MSLDKEAAARGRVRMLELAEQNKRDIADFKAGLVRSLERTPTVMEDLAAEQIAIVVVRIRRLLDRNHDCTAERQELAQLVRNSPWFAESPREAAPFVQSPPIAPVG